MRVKAALSAKGELRLFELDGLRGWASLSVLLFHAFHELFGAVEPAFRSLTVVLFVNGGLAVAIFFVLSGEALSVPYWGTRDRRYVLRQMLKRYPRLTIPILFSCLITFLLLEAQLVFSHQAAVVVDSPYWLGRFLAFSPSVESFFSYVMFNVYATNVPELSYNPFLWTMRIELIGSFLIFVLLLSEPFVGTKTARLLWPVALIVLILGPYYACFLFGLLFSRLQASGAFAKLRKTRWLQPASLGAMVGALLLGFAAERDYVPMHIAFAAAAVLFVFFCHCNAAATNFFRSRLSRALGTISFPLYLVQFSVLISFSSLAILFVSSRSGLTIPSMIAIALLTVALSIIASIVFLPIERMTHAVCRRIGRMMPAGQADGGVEPTGDVRIW
jgi:peptidoglycan/LPS O-acetylase OafA/YrhL